MSSTRAVWACNLVLPSTDFAFVVMHQQGANLMMSGKTTLGCNAAAAVGPAGAQATSYNTTAMNVDVLTYSSSKELFAGVSLQGASMESDDDANKSAYGQEIAAKDIVRRNQVMVLAAKSLVNLLDRVSPSRK
jgi:SH3 domain-containing YSC84-like protein 1